MSLDICLNDADGDLVLDKNYTHNVTPMWKKAGCYDALYMSDGKKAAEVIPELVGAVTDMLSDPRAYEELNPANGWGSYETALPWLVEVTMAFSRYPDATIGVSK